MIAFVSGASATLRRYADTGLFGRLIVPGAGNRPDDDPPLPWAADNGAFAGFNEAAFTRMLDRLEGVPGGRFVACPDVVGDAVRTGYLYDEWAPAIMRRGLPVAYVAQDGIGDQSASGVPWGACDALFVGGSTEFKLGAVARGLIFEAKARGHWVHVGRVNTGRRVRYFHALGVDSIDGTCLSMWADVHFPTFVNLLGTPQLALEVDR